MVGGDHVHGAVQDPLPEGVPVPLFPERRVHLEPSLLPQLLLREQQVVGSRLAAHIQPLALGPADQRHALGGGHMADVVGAACLPYQTEIPLYLTPLALPADAPVSMGAGVGPVVDVAAAQQRLVLAVGHDHLPQTAGLFHGLTHPALALHALAVIGKGDHPPRHGLHVGQLLPPLAPGDGSVRVHGDEGGAGDGLLLAAQRLPILRHGGEIGHGAQRGVAPPGRRRRAAADGLLIRKTRLPQMHMHICETGKNHHIPGINGNTGALGTDGGHNTAGKKNILLPEYAVPENLTVPDTQQHLFSSFSPTALNFPDTLPRAGGEIKSGVPRGRKIGGLHRKAGGGPGIFRHISPGGKSALRRRCTKRAKEISREFVLASPMISYNFVVTYTQRSVPAPPRRRVQAEK